MSDNTNRVNETGFLTICKIVAIAVLVYPVIYYGLAPKEPTKVEENPENLTSLKLNATINRKIHKKVVVIEQPSCPLSYVNIILLQLCKDLSLQSRQCTPQDLYNLEKHKLPKHHAKNNTTGEPRGTIVGCVAAGLLITSLGAAIVEFYKAKSQTPTKTKAPMSRKCSLADLTVLKHHRKELVRRESIMELPEDGASKPMDFRPPPLNRRCSFPVGPSDCNFEMSNSRQSSIQSRRFSVVDSRKSSIDGRKSSISVDNESPDRRHWTRLVHRH